jgi:hypothetical protein
VKQKLNINSARHTQRNDQKIHSLGTARNYEQALARLTNWIQENKLGSLKNLDAKKANDYLELRGQCVGQKTLDQAQFFRHDEVIGEAHRANSDINRVKITPESYRISLDEQPRSNSFRP